MNLLTKTLTIAVLILSPVANAALMLDTAIISYEGMGYFGFEYTGDGVYYEDGYDEYGSETFEADFGNPRGDADFNLITIAMDIEDLIVHALPYIRYGGVFPGVEEALFITGQIDGLNCGFGGYAAGCLINDEWVDIAEATLFATYKEVARPPINDVPEPSIIALFAAGLFGLGFARRKKA